MCKMEDDLGEKIGELQKEFWDADEKRDTDNKFKAKAEIDKLFDDWKETHPIILDIKEDESEMEA